MSLDSVPANNLVADIRSSLGAKLERLLRRPVIAKVADAAPVADVREPADQLPDLFLQFDRLVRPSAPTQGLSRRPGPWCEDAKDGTCSVRILLDYDDLWRGAEKEVLEAVVGTVEGFVTFLTDEQKRLLERSPREFLALNPSPEVAELVTFKKEVVGGVERVTELTLAEPPKSPAHIRYVAIVPNLIPLERQLAALTTIERATADGPLAPLRALVGLEDSAVLSNVRAATSIDPAGTPDRLDDFQELCVRKALTTPHFAVIKGPPGSGKTTVISTIIRQSLARGERVLVVSPTHVAVDNVVEKLAPAPDAKGQDDLELRTLPVRFAARSKKLLPGAAAYWIGPKSEKRAGTLSRRLERRLSEAQPLARSLYAKVDDEVAGQAPLSQALARVHGAICGTPIGILSFEPVKAAEAGSFDLLVVDEVSKMTLPEFLAIAVKARRWVLVGDPDQLPPYNNIEENGETLDALLSPHLELVCSIGAALERTKPPLRPSFRLVVVSTAPDAVVQATRAHVQGVGLEGAPPIETLDAAKGPGVIVCSPADFNRACEFLSPVRHRDRTFNPEPMGSVSILVERGVGLPRPTFASGMRLVEPRMRAQALIFDNAFAVYHAQPWAKRAQQKLTVVRFRNGLDKYLPSEAAIRALGDDPVAAREVRCRLIEGIASRYAINAVSVYDWLTGVPVEEFDTTPLRDLGGVMAPLVGLRDIVHPFVGLLRKQYRMHASLSKVPRELFYFGDALEDGVRGSQPGCRARLLQVQDGGAGGETNPREATHICTVLAQLSASGAAAKEPSSILVITPYRAQERLLAQLVDQALVRGDLNSVNVEVCTLDRCQGREADYVFISLVRNRATPFLDAPKRWNVALTRAKQGLFLVGDIDAYLREAAAARREVLRRPEFERPLMSMLARILESYDRQIAGSENPQLRSA
jgi:hypothetical protein